MSTATATATIKFSCGKCARVIRTPATFAGRVGKCPGCSSAIHAPTARRPAPAPVVAPAPARSKVQLGLLVAGTLLMLGSAVAIVLAAATGSFAVGALIPFSTGLGCVLRAERGPATSPEEAEVKALLDQLAAPPTPQPSAGAPPRRRRSSATAPTPVSRLSTAAVKVFEMSLRVKLPGLAPDTRLAVETFVTGRDAPPVAIEEGQLRLDDLQFVELVMALEQGLGAEKPDDDLLDGMNTWTVGQLAAWFEAHPAK